MNRQEFNEKAEKFADWALEKIRSSDYSWVIIITLIVLLAVLLSQL
jgi:hypothetical protein